MFLTAELCQFEWLGGWPSAFYLYGLKGIFFCVIWIYWVSDTPLKSKKITECEYNFIGYDSKNENNRNQKSQVKFIS